MLMRTYIAGTVLLALAACAPDFNPPPDYQGGFLMDSDRSRTVAVEPGDTLYIISRRYDVPTRVIAARNGLMPPYTLAVGQTLILDPSRTYKAQDGDTVASIARRYSVDEATLASANDFPMGAQIKSGTDLWIPDPFTSAAGPVRGLASVNTSDLPPVMAAPRNTRPITSENLPPLSAGVLAEQPPVSAPVAVQPVAPSVEVINPAQPLAPQPLAPQPLAPAVPPETNVASLPPQRPTVPAPSSTSGVQFTWPVSGAILARFGAAGKGLHNDGINIAAPAGTQVRAAGGGVVAYAGNELKGFGNLLLIKHADGWTTAYAHNDKLLVAKGDTVVQGQVIAVVGRTGNVDRPQLHFEVRKGTQALDPMAYLAK